LCEAYWAVVVAQGARHDSTVPPVLHGFDHIDEELVPLAFADELKLAQAKYDLMCSQTIIARTKAGSDAAMALWARNKWGWDRPNSTMTFKVPDQNGDIGDDNKITIELVKAPSYSMTCWNASSMCGRGSAIGAWLASFCRETLFCCTGPRFSSGNGDWFWQTTVADTIPVVHFIDGRGLVIMRA
jgi:hypothetical protein